MKLEIDATLPDGAIAEIPGMTMLGSLKLNVNSTNPKRGEDAVSRGEVDGTLNGFVSSSITSGTFSKRRYESLTGDVTYDPNTGEISLDKNVAVSGVYTNATVDAKGRVTGGSSISTGQIVSVNFGDITNKPSTLSGYGITDKQSRSTDITGTIVLAGSPTVATDSATKAFLQSEQGKVFNNAKVGTVIRSGGTATPVGYLRANGSSVSKTTYSVLYAVIGDTFNSQGFDNEGGTKFQLPDYETALNELYTYYIRYL